MIHLLFARIRLATDEVLFYRAAHYIDHQHGHMWSIYIRFKNKDEHRAEYRDENNWSKDLQVLDKAFLKARRRA